MRQEQVRALVERFYNEMWNGWCNDTAREILADDIEFRGSIGLQVTGHDGFIGYMNTIRGAFPDFHNRIDELVVEGDRVVARLTYSGTHEGPLFDHPPSGKRIEYAGVAMFTFRGGKIARVWVLGDLWSLMRQIGAVAD